MTLADYITRHLRVPFFYGRMDCVLFAAGWVREKTGAEPLDGIAIWETERQAMRAVKAAGGLEAALDARFPRVNPNLAKDGDLALYGKSICIFSGDHIVGPGKDGLEFINRMEAACAWSI
ncbi:MAG: hypothetical protein H6R01_935 [Burkholderiaceae bacterium]|nr:hypothetical protein [Burkholderiaceae bacterium]